MAWARRAGATLEGTARTFAWFGDRMEEEYACSACCYAGAIYASGSYYSPWLGRQMGGLRQYPVYDGTGTVRRVVNEQGGAMLDTDPDAFGYNRGGPASTAWYPYRFGGARGYRTDPSGLLQLGARFYWPELGRWFIQQDPAGDGVNWYAYADDNPLTGIDPEGLGEGLETFKGLFSWGNWQGAYGGGPTRWYNPFTWSRGPALVAAGMGTAGVGALATGVGNAGRAGGAGGGAWCTAGTYAKGVGIGAALAGGVVAYIDARDKSTTVGSQFRKRNRDAFGKPDPNEPDPLNGLYLPSGDKYEK